MDPHTLLINLLIFLSAAVIAVPLAKRLGLGSVIGYLIAGAVIGPWGFQFISNVKDVLTFSEFGVVLLMFVIGLELKPRQLWGMRRDIFGMGLTQIVLTMLILLLPLYLWQQNLTSSMIIAFGLALSSTAFALQLLREKNELNSSYGQRAFSILLFQDIAVIPAMVILPLLMQNTSTASPLKMIVTGLAAMAAIFIAGKYLLRPVFRIIAKVESREIFTALTLLLVFSIAVMMESAGFSMALGTFTAGVILSESEYRHELEVNIEPFKGLLLGLFFIAVGMSIDFSLIFKQPLFIAVAVLLLVVLKILALFITGRIFLNSPKVSRNMAMIICQGGEFAFVLFKISADKLLIENETASMLNAVVAFSMLATPLVYALNNKYLNNKKNPKKEFDIVENEHNEVIIAGFGRFGQMIGRVLRVNDIPFTALELDPDQVEIVRKFGYKVYYGDAGREDLLEAAGAASAKIFILAVDDPDASFEIATIVRKHYPHLKIFARARNRAHVYKLMDVGVDDIRRETMASSLETAVVTLNALGISEKKAISIVQRFRNHDEEILLEQYKIKDDEKNLINYSKQAVKQLTDAMRQDKLDSQSIKDTKE